MMKKTLVVSAIAGLISLTPNLALGYSTTFTLVNNSTIESLTITRIGVMTDTGTGQHGNWHCPAGAPANPNFVSVNPGGSQVCQLTTTSGQLNQAFLIYASLPNPLESPAVSQSKYETYCGYSGAPSLCTAGIPTQRIFHQNVNNTTDPRMTSPNSSEIDYISPSCPTLQEASNMLNESYATGQCPNTLSLQKPLVDLEGRTWYATCSPSGIAPNTNESGFNEFRGTTITVTPQGNGLHSKRLQCMYANNTGNSQTTYAMTLNNFDQKIVLPPENTPNWTIKPNNKDAVSGVGACVYGMSNITDTTLCQWTYAGSAY